MRVNNFNCVKKTITSHLPFKEIREKNWYIITHDTSCGSSLKNSFVAAWRPNKATFNKVK